MLYALMLAWEMHQWYKEGRRGHASILLLLPSAIISIIYFSPILLALPILLLAVRYLGTAPRASSILVSLGSTLMIHPLLGYFLLFFTKEKKVFGITALLSTLILLFLPLTVMSWENLWDCYKSWITGFRNPPSGTILSQEFSLIHLIREHQLMPEWLLRLFVVNLFHYQLLPCLKSRRLADPTVLLNLFGSSIILFIGLFSGMNTPYTAVIAMSGVVAWMRFSNYSSRIKYTLGGISLFLTYLSFMLGSLTRSIGPTEELMVILPMSVVWFLNVFEIWRYIYKNKVSTS